MRLLFDENISFKLVGMLADVLECKSVYHVSLSGKSDDEVWQYARQYRAIIVSKDSDFLDRAIGSEGVKFVWIRLGNCSTEAIHLVLRNSLSRLQEFSLGEDTIISLP